MAGINNPTSMPGRYAMKTRLFLAGCLYLWIAVVAHAQQSPQSEQLPDGHMPASCQPAPAPVSTPTQRVEQPAPVFHKKIFWALAGADAASAVADAQTSWHNEKMYPNSVEQNSWLYGRRPSLARYYGTFAAIDGGNALLSYRFLHSRHKAVRLLGWGELSFAVPNHLYSVRLNLKRR
jgi:hypothetical protein